MLPITLPALILVQAHWVKEVSLAATMDRFSVSWSKDKVLSRVILCGILRTPHNITIPYVNLTLEPQIQAL
jgi:hypothetical protein